MVLSTNILAASRIAAAQTPHAAGWLPLLHHLRALYSTSSSSSSSSGGSSAVSVAAAADAAGSSGGADVFTPSLQQRTEEELRQMMLKQGTQAGGLEAAGAAAAGAGAGGAGAVAQAGVRNLLSTCLSARTVCGAVCQWPASHPPRPPRALTSLPTRCVRAPAPARPPARCRGLPRGARRLGATPAQSPPATAIGRSRAGAPTSRCCRDG